METHLELNAYAKINLGLDITGRREDGYHLVDMIMQSIRLHDRVFLEKEKEAGIRLSSNYPWVPAGDTNLAVRAAKLLFEEFGITEGLAIRLEKRIPVAAGLAGGSTDAAAVLYGVNRMYGLGLSREELRTRGCRLGADVPFCLMRGTARARGIGEILEELPAAPSCHVVLAKPREGVSTKDAYAAYDRLDPVGIVHPSADGIAGAVRDGDYRTLCSLLGNVLELVTIPSVPVIEEIKGAFRELHADGVLMSGSGPTVFGLFADEADAEKAYRELKTGRFAGMADKVVKTGFYNRRIPDAE